MGLLEFIPGRACLRRVTARRGRRAPSRGRGRRPLTQAPAPPAAHYFFDTLQIAPNTFNVLATHGKSGKLITDVISQAGRAVTLPRPPFAAGIRREINGVRDPLGQGREARKELIPSLKAYDLLVTPLEFRTSMACGDQLLSYSWFRLLKKETQVTFLSFNHLTAEAYPAAKFYVRLALRVPLRYHMKDVFLHDS
ncbi:hypothetical protein EVAR_94694_1 [Eumeta japonica]|uniref:Uncharacterized protein n=1 Tax=Eumeta variegata TaxID=151549 RepID=A0A4C1UXM3_EUMVA|nr:hypothetical protein EVAR_94694_1 [Eumeta japonica]